MGMELRLCVCIGWLCYDVYIFSTFTYNTISLLAPSLPPSLSFPPYLSLSLSLSLLHPSLSSSFPLTLSLFISSLPP